MSPPIQRLYLYLYRANILLIVLLTGLAVGVYCVLRIGGVHENPLSGKKKLILVSEAYEKRIANKLAYIVLSQMEQTSVSEGLVRRNAELVEQLNRWTGSTYKMSVVNSADHILVVLPEQVVISRNLLLSPMSQRQLSLLLLVMEGLFVQRLHIRELSLSSVAVFAGVLVKSTPEIDIKLTKIYSRKYSEA